MAGGWGFIPKFFSFAGNYCLNHGFKGFQGFLYCREKLSELGFIGKQQYYNS